MIGLDTYDMYEASECLWENAMIKGCLDGKELFDGMPENNLCSFVDDDYECLATIKQH